MPNLQDDSDDDDDGTSVLGTPRGSEEDEDSDDEDKRQCGLGSFIDTQPGVSSDRTSQQQAAKPRVARQPSGEEEMHESEEDGVEESILRMLKM